MPAAKDPAAPYTLPLSLLVCIAATVAAVGSARYWEAATVVSYWAWLAGDAAAALAAHTGAHALGAAATATVVTFAAVVLGCRAAQTALNRRDAAVAARQSNP